LLDKNREISLLERERKVAGKGSGEKVGFKTRMEDPAVRHADHRFWSGVRAIAGDGGEHSEVAN